jgi:hypothetical protein
MIHKILGLPDPHPDPLVRDTDPDPAPSVIKKIVRKTSIPTVLCFLYDFSSMKNDVNVPSKSNKQNLEKTFFVDVLKVTDENSRIRIH